VVAPTFDASGSSASMTAVARDGKVLVEQVGGHDQGPVLAVHGPPAFIVRAAMFGAFGAPPDLVLSGVNRGLNTGRAVLHSGTVGAALTAANYGRKGLAVSAEVGPDDIWRPGSAYLSDALAWLDEAPDATVLNVNVPSRSHGVRRTRLVRAGTVQGQVSESGGDFVQVVFSDSEGIAPPGTDAAALADGYVSVTAIRAVDEDDRVDLDRIIGSSHALH
jgi:5'-nucleotidase